MPRNVSVEYETNNVPDAACYEAAVVIRNAAVNFGKPLENLNQEEEWLVEIIDHISARYKIMLDVDQVMIRLRKLQTP